MKDKESRNQSFKKTGAFAILLTIITPLFVWAGGTLVRHGNEIARLQENEKNTKEHVIDIKKDVRFIREYIIKKGR